MYIALVAVLVRLEVIMNFDICGTAFQVLAVHSG